jgi:hypothetical protein
MRMFTPFMSVTCTVTCVLLINQVLFNITKHFKSLTQVERIVYVRWQGVVANGQRSGSCGPGE